MGVFTSDQYKPSVHYEEPEQAGNDQPILSSGSDPSLAPSEPKVMEIDEDPSTRPDPLPDWRVPYLDCLVREMLSVDKIEARHLARRAKSFIVI